MALEAKPAAISHLSEEALENYAFGRLPGAELAAFEEHLLLCGRCQEKLTAEDDFAEAVRAFAATESAFGASADPSHPHEGANNHAVRALVAANPGNWRIPLVSAGAIGALAIGIGVAAWLMPAPTQTAELVHLKTLRGGGDESGAEAQPDRPLELAIDLGEIAHAAAEGGPYHLEVVDAAGRPAWTATEISSVSGHMSTRVEKRLATGIYWVRLYAHSGKLLREFSLHVG